MEMHLDELPENLRGDKKVILQLIEKRRRKIEQQLLMHHPEILDHLKKNRERLRDGWKNRIRRQRESCMNGNGRCRKNRRTVRAQEFPDDRNTQEICRRKYAGIRRIILRESIFLAIIHGYIGQ